jgi:glutaminase
MLVSCLNNPKEDFLDFIKLISGSTTIEYNNAVAQSEKITV